MTCESCGYDRAHLLQFVYMKDAVRKSCEQCGASGGGVPDVYFKGPYWDEHIASEEHPNPKFITSRTNKQYWLDKCNLRESGDRVHGANRFDPISHRHAEESLRVNDPRRKGYGR